MDTRYIFSPKQRAVGKHSSENNRLYLLIILLGLLVLFFSFWKTADSGYAKQAWKGNEVTISNKIEKADPATMYKTIVTNGDAIRSVLQ